MNIDALLEQTGFKWVLKYTPILISFIAVIGLSIILSKLVWLWLSPKEIISNTNTVKVTSKLSQSTTQANDYGKKIADLHLFGVADKKPVVKQTVIKTVTPVTRLNLKLHGTFAYGNQTGFAVISASGKKQKTYEKGDKIEGSSNTRLAKIFPDYVMLDRDGKKERLQLPKSKNASSVNRPPPSVSSPVRPTVLSPKVPMINMPTTNVPPKPDQALVDPNNLDGLRQKLLKNPAKFMEIAQVSEAKEANKFIGFRLRAGKDRRTFEAMGFKSGDIVTAVNGAVIENAAQGLQIMQTLTTADSINVTVRRGKETVTLNGMF
jgi:general secretion pathway protein C